jgi:uncharacterized lipoprotein NlpE involved in copper resistance
MQRIFLFFGLLFILLMALALLGCNNSSEYEKSKTSSIVVEGLDAEVNEFTIDGCQYLEFAYSSYSQGEYAVAVTHKGNCINH